jgi:hypothetical protein
MSPWQQLLLDFASAWSRNLNGTTPSLHLIGKEPRLTILTWKAYDPPLATSPKANNSNFLSTPTTGLQHCASEPPKITVSTDAVLPVGHGGKISTMSYTAQVTDAQWHETKQKLNSLII